MITSFSRKVIDSSRLATLIGTGLRAVEFSTTMRRLSLSGSMKKTS
jgi:hypothetical protein